MPEYSRHNINQMCQLSSANNDIYPCKDPFSSTQHCSLAQPGLMAISRRYLNTTNAPHHQA